MRNMRLLRGVAVAFVLVAAIASSGVPAGAHDLDGTEVSFEATPCAQACGFLMRVRSLSTEDPFESFRNPCSPAFLFPASIAEYVTPPAPQPPPGKVVLLEVTLDSTVDWDLYICAIGSPEIRAQGANLLLEPCDGSAGEQSLVPVGCHEDASVLLVPGQSVILRAVNVSDPFPARGEYRFTYLS